MLDTKKYVAIFLLIVMAFFFSTFWEIAVEGPNGGASSQYGWRINTGFGKSIYLTQYHFFLWYVSIPMFLIIPLIITGFDKKLISIIFLGYFVGSIVEDFSWVAFNPYFGLSKFSPEYITWFPWLDLGFAKISILYIIWSIGAFVSLITFLKIK